MSGTRQYNEYLEQKHRKIFRFLDRSSEGQLTRQDILNRVDKMASLNVLNEMESDYTKACWMKWCNILYPTMNPEENMTEDSFVEKMRGFFNSGEITAHSVYTEGIYNVLFDRLDANRDGQISRDELKIYYKSIGSATDKFIDKIFRILDENKDGQLVKHEFIKAGMEYWMNDDPSSGSEAMYDVDD